MKSYQENRIRKVHKRKANRFLMSTQGSISLWGPVVEGIEAVDAEIGFLWLDCYLIGCGAVARNIARWGRAPHEACPAGRDDGRVPGTLDPIYGWNVKLVDSISVGASLHREQHLLSRLWRVGFELAVYLYLHICRSHISATNRKTLPISWKRCSNWNMFELMGCESGSKSFYKNSKVPTFTMWKKAA